MSIAIDIDETTRNQILAALDERVERLEKAVLWVEVWSRDHKLNEDAQRSLVWNIAALHECNMARLLVAEAGEPVATLAEAVPWEPAVKTDGEASAYDHRAYHDVQAR